MATITDKTPVKLSIQLFLALLSATMGGVVATYRMRDALLQKVETSVKESIQEVREEQQNALRYYVNHSDLAALKIELAEVKIRVATLEKWKERDERWNERVAAVLPRNH